MIKVVAGTFSVDWLVYSASNNFHNGVNNKYNLSQVKTKSHIYVSKGQKDVALQFQ